MNENVRNHDMNAKSKL